MPHTREAAIRSTMSILRGAKDWQEGQHYLANHDRFRAWIDAEAGGDEGEAMTIAQGIIREAEARLGDALPY